jgi:penicillin-binding protein A
MGKLRPDINKPPQRCGWREYQHQLQRPRRTFNRRWALGIALLLVACCTLYAGLGSPAAPATKALPTTSVAPATKALPAASAPSPNPATDLIGKNDVRLLLANLNARELLLEQIQIPVSSQHLQVDTSLDLDLQGYLLEKMDRKNSSLIGVAVMEADTGRMLTLAGFNKAHPDDNPCLSSEFPAASIFKIVTAAAAIDHCGLNADTIMHFNGYKHTLYKSQLKEQANQYTNSVSFKNSFAQSINPVFGKLGALKLGKTVLEEYATAFGFNQPIDFELPLDASHLQIKPGTYNWAEIACGFNRDTTISPIHAAVMASAVLNKGRMVTPTVVDRITDENGHLIYQNHPSWRKRAMTTRASQVLADLMATTVSTGTGRKSFRDQHRNKVLSQLNIGGKTGSIYNRTHDARYDWFVGFAQEKHGSGQLAIAVLVAHEEYIGIRATEYARMAISHYFKGLLAHHDGNKENSGS